MKQNNPHSWLINRFSYIQTYIFVCCLFFLSLLPLSYFWFKDYLNHKRELDWQIQKVQQQSNVKKLFEYLQQHRTLAHHYLMGNREVRVALETLQIKIDELMHQQKPINQTALNSNLFEEQQNKQLLGAEWMYLKQNVFNLSIDKSDQLHTNLLYDLEIQLDYLNNQLNIHFINPHSVLYKDLEVIFLRLPDLQEHLSQLSLIAEDALTLKKLPTEQQALFFNLISFIQSDLFYLRNQLRINDQLRSKNEQIAEIETNLNHYYLIASNFINPIQDQLNQIETSTLSLPQLLNLSENIFLAGSHLWSQALQDFEQHLIQEKHNWIVKLLFILLLTLPLIALSFYLGLAVTNNATHRLKQLTKATDSFTNGNLSVRVPPLYHDEVGRLSQAFNRMGQRLEEIVNHLYELIDATTALASGDLTARIEIKNKQNDEFNQVAISFNKMAETFEIIINRLHQLGIIFTSTATEIVAASKEQEAIIVEQEATTCEIAVAANEISSTAKEFANTMNEISHVAEQTSNLAVTGKDSLTNMESIMRQMVEASTSIASKLAILNEKAGNITNVITTITKVADQTNLLSLNASIEAEKAGEYGRSFAVIAREIRRLADQTAVATLDIETSIDEIMAAISSSVMGVDDFTQEIRQGVDQVKHVSNQLARIIEQVQAFTARFEIVNQGMQAQSSGAEQITAAINQLSQTAQQTSSSIHHFLTTIEELNKAANELRVLTPAIRGNIKANKIPSSSNQITNLFTNVAAESQATDFSKQFSRNLINLNDKLSR